MQNGPNMSHMSDSSRFTTFHIIAKHTDIRNIKVDILALLRLFAC